MTGTVEAGADLQAGGDLAERGLSQGVPVAHPANERQLTAGLAADGRSPMTHVFRQARQCEHVHRACIYKLQFSAALHAAILYAGCQDTRVLCSNTCCGMVPQA